MRQLENGIYPDNDQMFWMLQVAGWAGLALLMYVSYTLTFNQTQLPYLLHPLVQSGLGIVVSWPMRYIFHWSWNKRLHMKLIVALATILFFSLVWTILRLVTFIYMSGESKNFLLEFGPWYFPGILIFTCWVAIYHGFRYYRFLEKEHANLVLAERGKQQERLARERAEKLAKEAQLKMLRYQLNPHFLFNTMNAITSLVRSGKNEDACEVMDSLNVFLRNSLDGDPLRLVSLESELTALRNYLGIEQTRFGERLHVIFDISQEAEEIHVPHLILQPLAENAIKYAVRPSINPVTLAVRACVDKHQLVIRMEDTGPGIENLAGKSSGGDGIGLRNVRDRLRNMYGDEQELVLENRSSGGLRVTIRIPAANKQDNQKQENQAGVYA